MGNIVKVGSRGQITIPLKIRRQYGIEEGGYLQVEVTEKGILFKSAPKLQDLAGIYDGYATTEEINKMIDKLRDEY